MIQIVKKQKPNSIKIKKLRERLNLSQEEFLAKMKEDLGYTMSRRTYQRIEKGERIRTVSSPQPRSFSKASGMTTFRKLSEK